MTDTPTSDLLVYRTPSPDFCKRLDLTKSFTGLIKQCCSPFIPSTKGFIHHLPSESPLLFYTSLPSQRPSKHGAARSSGMGSSFCKGKCSRRAKSALSCQAFTISLSSGKEHDPQKRNSSNSSAVLQTWQHQLRPHILVLFPSTSPDPGNNQLQVPMGPFMDSEGLAAWNCIFAYGCVLFF